jgi:hypothetical protein
MSGWLKRKRRVRVDAPLKFNGGRMGYSVVF